jgi:hypothetical protein
MQDGSMSESVIEASYRSWAALHRDLESQIKLGGLLLRATDVDLEQFSPLVLNLRAPSGRQYEIAGQVLQVIPGQGVAMQLGAASRDAIDALRQEISGQSIEGEAPSDDPTVSLPSAKPSARVQLPADPVELRRALEEMTVNQKRQVALSGRREVRLLLIKDINKAVHPFVLKNPGITLEEVEAFSKMPSVNPDALRMIAKNRDWTKSQAICRNLVKNPKTPINEALILLERLPIGDLRVFAKGGTVRTPIQQAARKKINQ